MQRLIISSILTVLLVISILSVSFFFLNPPLVFGEKAVQSKATSLKNPLMKELIHYGTLAPSSHNVQMWKVKIVSTSELLIKLDTARLLPEVDPLNQEALISLGAFIENIVQAGAAYELKANFEILNNPSNPSEIARLIFEPNNEPPTQRLLSHISLRHTIRTPFIKKSLSKEATSCLFSKGNIRYFPYSSNEGLYLKKAIILAMQAQVNNDHKQQELANWTRFSSKEAQTSKDGLTPTMMGLKGIAKWFVEHFFTKKTVLSSSYRNQTIKLTTKQAEHCSGFAIITAPDHSISSLIEVGRQLERFWLKATELKVAVHPMSAPLEESPWKNDLAKELKSNEAIYMLLRLGYVKNYGQPASERRSVASVIETD